MELDTNVYRLHEYLGGEPATPEREEEPAWMDDWTEVEFAAATPTADPAAEPEPLSMWDRFTQALGLSRSPSTAGT